MSLAASRHRSYRLLQRHLNSWKPGIRRHLVTSCALRNIVTSDVPDIELPTGNYFNTVFEKTSKWSDKIAAECSITGRRYTYGSLLDKASRWGGALRKLGVTKGDVVAVALMNCPEYPIAVFGALSIGASVTTVSVAYTAEEICKQLNDCQASVVVGDPAIEKALQGALVSYKKPAHLVMNGPSTLPGAIDLQKMLDDPTIPYVDPVLLSGDEIALLPYSSGTTGPPKGVAISHNAMIAGVKTFIHPYFHMVGETTADHQEAFNCVMPFYHVYGLLPIMGAGLHNGIKLVTVPKFDPNTFVETVHKHQVRFLHLVPPLLNFLIHSPTAKAESLSHVRSIMCGAAPVPPSGAQAIIDKLQTDIFFQEGYGMSETLLSMIVPIGSKRLGTIGKVIPNVKAKVVDLTTGEDLPVNAEGEICVTGPTIMTGYHNNSEATKATIDDEGWLHTGDVGFYDEEKYFKIVDRCKELIKVKGLQVSPSELEDLIRQHPGILDVGVVGVPDDRLGEAPMAYVIEKGGVTEDDVNKFLEPRIAAHKRLVGGVKFVDSLPKSPTGKLLRRELKKISQS